MVNIKMEQARFRSECMDCINELKKDVKSIRKNGCELSVRMVFENIRFFLYCRNGDIPNGKLSFDKMMAHYQEMLDVIMFPTTHKGETYTDLCNINDDGTVFKWVKGQDAQAVHMGKSMIREKECLEGWLWGASRYGHK